MNRVNNWLFVSLFFFVLAMGTMIAYDAPAVAWAFGAPTLAALAMALIRYEDFRKDVPIGCGV